MKTCDKNLKRPFTNGYFSNAVSVSDVRKNYDKYKTATKMINETLTRSAAFLCVCETAREIALDMEIPRFEFGIATFDRYGERFGLAVGFARTDPMRSSEHCDYEELYSMISELCRLGL